MRSKSSIVRSTPASRATASRWSTAFVEPPLIATAAIAFSSASRVMMWLGRWPRASTSITSFPVANATSALRASCAGTPESRIGEMPITSKAIAIVLAVNWPPQAPGPGEATSSSATSSSSVIRPAAWAPTASKTSWIVTVRPWKCPGAIEPP
jgi:hypothetical protein